VLARATVDLGTGKTFRVSSPAGTAQPPGCPAHQAGPAAQPSTTPASATQPTPGKGNGLGLFLFLYGTLHPGAAGQRLRE
jgi:hypothetical protein